MRKGRNKKGSRTYSKFIDSYRKTLPQQTKSSMKKHRRKTLDKSQMDFQVEPNNKIRSKFSTAQSEDSDLRSKPSTAIIQNTHLEKAIKGTPGFEVWLEKFRAARAAHAKGPQEPVKFSSSHSALLDSARKGDLNMMHHPEAHNIRDSQGFSILHHLARAGKKEVLGHDHVHDTRDSLGRSPLHLLAEKNIPEVLGHPMVSQVRDHWGNTPLHTLAQQKNPAVLEHPDVSIVKNERGRTPLHSAAFARIEESQQHPDFKVVQDSFGKTPFDIWNSFKVPEQPKEGAVVAKSYHEFIKELKKSDPTKGIILYCGLRINVEWPKGDIRTYKKDGKIVNGKKMAAHYGYVMGTYTEDGEEIDVYVGSTVGSNNVYLLLQKPTPWDVKNGFTKPEEKYMLRFSSMKAAEKAYKNSMPSEWFDSIREITFEEFMDKVTDGELQLERAKKAGLVILPQDITGKKCGTCKYFKDDFCVHTAVNMPVTQKMSCNLWENQETKIVGDEKPDVEKAVGAYTPMHDTPGMLTTDKKNYMGFEEFKKAQTELKKELENMPQITAQQGSKEQGAVYSFSDADNFSKNVTHNKNRLKLAKKLKEISKANAFVGNAGFVARKNKEVPDNSLQSKPFVSEKKSLDEKKPSKEEQYNRQTNPFLTDLGERLKKFRKSVATENGFNKYDFMHKIYRMEYNKDRLKTTVSDESEKENSDVKAIKKSIGKAVRNLNKIPRFVFTL